MPTHAATLVVPTSATHFFSVALSDLFLNPVGSVTSASAKSGVNGGSYMIAGYLAIKGISAIKCRNGKCVIYDENIKRKGLKDWFSKKGIVKLNEYARNNLLEEKP